MDDEADDEDNEEKDAASALAGPGASRAAARRLGFDDGFGLDVPPAQVAAVCAREAVSRAEFCRSSSSPPCYL